LSVLSRRNGLNSKSKKNEELDGYSEEDTVVHRELVDFYKEKGLSLPDFLLSRTHPATSGSKIPRTEQQPRPDYNENYNERNNGVANERGKGSANAPYNSPTHLPIPRSNTTPRSVSALSKDHANNNSRSFAASGQNTVKSSTVPSNTKQTLAARPTAQPPAIQQTTMNIPQRSRNGYHQSQKPAAVTPPQQNISTFGSLSPETSTGNTSPSTAGTTRRFRRKHI